MNIKLEIKRAAVLSVLALTAGSACFASIPLFQDLPVSVQSGGQGTDCPGNFTANTVMTNSTGSVWISVPAGETNAVVMNMANTTNYSCVVSAMYRNTGMTYCAAEAVSFPVVAGGLYEYRMFVVSGTVTNGQPLAISVTYLP